MSDAQTTSAQPAVQPPQSKAAPVGSRGPSVLQIAIVVAILGGGVLVTSLTSDVTRVSEPGVRLENGKPYLAEKVGDWTGGELQGLTEDERRILPADTEGARRLYTDSEGNELYCSVVLAGRDVTSIHRPELCLPGQGWKIQTAHTQSIPLASAGANLEVMRLNSVRTVALPDGGTAQTRSIFLYWFVGKDRLTPHHWERLFWTAKDRVLHNTNHRWAYILIHAPVTADLMGPGRGKSEAETMEVLARFVRDIYPTFVPN